MLYLITYLGISAIAIVIGVIGWYVLQAVAYWRLFTKSGESGWKSLIPFYNTYIQYKISWEGKWYWLFFVFSIIGGTLSNYTGAALAISVILEIAAFVVSCYASYKLSLAFGHGAGYAVGLVLLSPIFILILGFGESRYIGKQ